MILVTNLGDLAVLLPVSLALIVLLARFGSRRDAAAYALALAVCLTAALVAKVIFAACGEGHAVFGVKSPSGHAAIAMFFYGCVAAMLGVGRRVRARVAIYGAACALILLIGMSRVAIRAHSVPEVAIGLAIGALCVALFVSLRQKPRRLDISRQALVRVSPFAAVFALCWLGLAGHWSAEPYIDAVAAQFGVALHLCR